MVVQLDSQILSKKYNRLLCNTNERITSAKCQVKFFLISQINALRTSIRSCYFKTLLFIKRISFSFCILFCQEIFAFFQWWVQSFFLLTQNVEYLIAHQKVTKNIMVDSEANEIIRLIKLLNVSPQMHPRKQILANTSP